MTSLSGSDPRLFELLADRALGALDSMDERELNSLLAAEGIQDDESFDLTAASLALSFVEPAPATLPEHVRERLLAAARSGVSDWATGGQSAGAQPRAADLITTARTASAPAAPTTAVNAPRSEPGVAGSIRPATERFRVLPWLAAAAGILLAVAAWWPRLGTTGNGGAATLVAKVDSRADAVHLDWKDWDNPEIPGVRGEIVWSDSAQEGYMRFEGLPPNDPSREQYQLWIIDKRGMQKRISGGVFNVDSSGEVVVPIEPGVRVKDAAAFAVTIEEPGGTPVSDMDRRVVIAAKG